MMLLISIKINKIKFCINIKNNTDSITMNGNLTGRKRGQPRRTWMNDVIQWIKQKK